MFAKLYVGNLPKSITQPELMALFTQAGDVIEVDLIRDKENGAAKGFAFVTMNTRSEAERAIYLFNTYPLNEQKIKVNMAQPPFQL